MGVLLHGCSTPFVEVPLTESSSESESESAASDDPDLSVAQNQTESSGAERGGENTARAEEHDLSLADLIEQVDDAVVFVTATDALGNDVAVGTGCIISSDGKVATNRHVIDQAARASVRLRDGGEYPVAGAVAESARHDLVILQVEGLPETIEVLPLREPPALRPGESLLAIGHPMEFQFTVSDGILSAVRRTHELPEEYREQLHTSADAEWLQTTAAISNGSSGGPLMTMQGKLVGLNTWIAAGQNLGFAISARHLLDLYQSATGAPAPLPLPDAAVVVGTRAAALQREFEDRLRRQFGSTSNDSDKRDSRRPWPSLPLAIYAAKCLELMQNSSTESDRIDAILLAHYVWSYSQIPSRSGQRHFPPMYEIAAEHLTQSPQLRRVIRSLGYGPHSPEMARLLWQVLDEHPEQEVQALAGMSLLRAMERSRYAERLIPERIELSELLRIRFADQVVDGIPVEETLYAPLLQLRSLRRGARALPLIGPGRDGEPVRLADLHGKTVVLDFHADAATVSQRFYEIRRQLQQSLEQQPFSILAVNCDETPQRFEELLDDGIVTWPDIFDGPYGSLASAWQVETLPHTWVIDSEGFIRYSDVSDDDLTDVVFGVVEENLVDCPGDLIAGGSEWRWYSADERPADWMMPSFEDLRWSRGQAPLGYGRPRIRTVTDYGDIGNKYASVCFRRVFEVRNPADCDTLILKLTIDDGAIVYLNGREVLSRNVRRRPDGSLQILTATEDEHWAELNPQDLQAGDNLLAVSVHQCDPTSADLQFDLSLSSRMMDVRKLRSARSTRTRMRFCRFAEQVPPENESLDELLRSFETDSDLTVRVLAESALLQRGARSTDDDLPNADPQGEMFRLMIASGLNTEIWPLIRTPGSVDGYEMSALGKARAAWKLSEDNESLRANTANTLGVVLYRLGRFEEAIRYFEESISLEGENPLDLICLALCRHELGLDEEAQQTMDRVQHWVDRPEWAQQDEAAVFLKEAQTRFVKHGAEQEL